MATIGILIGIPMPAVYVRMLGYVWGEPVAARACLLGEIFSVSQALALGMVVGLAGCSGAYDLDR